MPPLPLPKPQSMHTKFFPLLFALALFPLHISAQRINQMSSLLDAENKKGGFSTDSVEKTDVPEGIYAWHVDRRFGDIVPARYDTVPHMFQNEVFTSGPTGHYNYTGNTGAPRISRHFAEQSPSMMQNPFIFLLPYDYFVKTEEDLLFTNTKSPFTNITYHECGNKQNGEDRLRALFSVNSGKKLGFGFKADYLYGRGYYTGQSTAHFDGTLFSSYISDNYQLHAFYSVKQLKNRENGGVENDDYVTRPESFPTKYGTADMPINLSKAWNKMKNHTFFLTHRYNVGFHRFRDKNGNTYTREQVDRLFPIDTVKQQTPTAKPLAADSAQTLAANDTTSATPRMPRMPKQTETGHADTRQARMDSLGIREEFVPVTSFIHTMKISGNSRTFTSNTINNESNPGFFTDFYLPGDSARDNTEALSVENTLALEMHEGLNKWMKMGFRLFAKHEFDRFRLPDENRRVKNYVENYVTLGAQILSEQSRIVRYNVLGEFRTSGKEWGEFNVEGNASLNIPLRKDTLRFAFHGFVRNEKPSFYYRHYHARNAWWDNSDLNNVFRARVGAKLSYGTTSLSATLENVQNQIYFAETLTPTESTDGYAHYTHGVNVGQASKNAQLIALTLAENLHWGIFHWDTELTYQTSTNKDVLPVPAFTGYTNVYLQFRLAKVLLTELGADCRYFTNYYAPAYSPLIGQYALQDKTYATKVGNYPIVNAYINFHLKRTRFYVMASHVNYSSGSGNPFLVPHYPMNRMVLRLGLSWNFIN